MKPKVAATKNPRELKIVIPVFAAVSPVLNAAGRETKMGTFKSWYDQIIQLNETAGIDIVGALPITQQHGGEASPFSTDAYGLNHYYTYLPDVPEILASQALTQQVGQMYIQVGTQGRQNIDHIGYRTLHDEITKAASKEFDRIIALDKARKAAYEAFVERNDLWLSSNADFSVVQREMERRGLTPLFDSWPKEYQNPESTAVKALVREYPDEARCYIYRQFIADEQYQRYREDFKKRGIKIELNLPYGVSTEAGGTVWAHQGTFFDTRWYVGCYPEPHNGYPEQNWKIYQYKEGPALADFIRQKFEYLGQYADIVFLDHLCGWSNKYLVPKGLRDDQLGTEDGKRPARGHFEIPLYPTDRKRSEEYRHLDPGKAADKKQIMQVMEDNVYKVLKTIFDIGLEVGGETTGDPDRQTAVERALERLNKEGHQFRIMHVAPYKNWQGIYTQIPENTEFMATNHDQPTTWQILTNRRGEQKLWFAGSYPDQIANYLTQIYRVFTSPSQIPLVSEQLTRTLGIHLLEQQAAVPSYLLTVFINDLYALLYPDRVGNSTAVNLNEPGTTGSIRIEGGNWSVRIPNLDMTDPAIVSILNTLQQREKVDYDPVVRLREYGSGWFTFGSSLWAIRAAGREELRKIIYLDLSRRQYSELIHLGQDYKPVMELLISNISGHVNEGGVELTAELKKLIDPSRNYIVRDITKVEGDPGSSYHRTGQELLGVIYIKLEGGKDHHWIVYETPR